MQINRINYENTNRKNPGFNSLYTNGGQYKINQILTAGEDYAHRSFFSLSDRITSSSILSSSKFVDYLPQDELYAIKNIMDNKFRGGVLGDVLVSKKEYEELMETVKGKGYEQAKQTWQAELDAGKGYHAWEKWDAFKMSQTEFKNKLIELIQKANPISNEAEAGFNKGFESITNNLLKKTEQQDLV